MRANERRMRLIEELCERKFDTIDNLAFELGVSRRVGARRIPPRKKVSHRKAKGVARKAVRGADREGRRGNGIDTFAIHAGGRKKDGGQMKLEKVREDLQEIRYYYVHLRREQT